MVLKIVILFFLQEMDGLVKFRLYFLNWTEVEVNPPNRWKDFPGFALGSLTYWLWVQEPKSQQVMNQVRELNDTRISQSYIMICMGTIFLIHGIIFEVYKSWVLHLCKLSYALAMLECDQAVLVLLDWAYQMSGGLGFQLHHMVRFKMFFLEIWFEN